ncbi:MAG: ATP-binding protein [Thermodesulfovibrionales bacterium]
MSGTKAGKKIGDLFSLISSGEDGTRQFKVDVRNGDSLASDMAAFANSEGGTVLIGVADDGSHAGAVAGGCGSD